jgi:hypothetical protein
MNSGLGCRASDTRLLFFLWGCCTIRSALKLQRRDQNTRVFYALAYGPDKMLRCASLAECAVRHAFLSQATAVKPRKMREEFLPRKNR